MNIILAVLIILILLSIFNSEGKRASECQSGRFLFSRSGHFLRFVHTASGRRGGRELTKAQRPAISAAKKLSCAGCRKGHYPSRARELGRLGTGI